MCICGVLGHFVRDRTFVIPRGSPIPVLRVIALLLRLCGLGAAEACRRAGFFRLELHSKGKHIRQTRILRIRNGIFYPID